MLARDKCVFALIIFNLNFVVSQNVINSVKDFKGSPLVVLLNFKQRTGTIYDMTPNYSTNERSKSKALNDVNKALNDVNEALKDVTAKKDNGAYLLYHLLRTTQEKEKLDESTNMTFEKTKDLLRAALRSRCNKYERCVQLCVEKRYTCTITCKEEYDVYEICRLPVCGSSCWGHTMPPSWL